jgi:hypothetical protein
VNKHQQWRETMAKETPTMAELFADSEFKQAGNLRCHLFHLSIARQWLKAGYGWHQMRQNLFWP